MIFPPRYQNSAEWIVFVERQVLFVELKTFTITLMFTVNVKIQDSMTLWVTHECVLNCPLCIDRWNRHKRGFMSQGEAAKSLAYAKECGVKNVILSGGEPTMHPYIVDIAKMTKAEGFETIVTTNYMFPEMVKQLDEIVDTINISYYPENANRIPHKKDFKSHLCLKVLLHKESDLRPDEKEHRIYNCEQLDALITKFQNQMQIVFSTPRKTPVEWVNDLPFDRDEILDKDNPAQVYRGCIINRKDLKVNMNSYLIIDMGNVLIEKSGTKENGNVEII